MPKIALDQDAVKGFFIHHVEKIVLFVVLLLFFLFVYSGYSLEGLDNEKTPDQLASLAQQADSHIVTDTWAVVAEEHKPPSGFELAARESSIATTDVPYTLSKPLMPSSSPSGVKRIDPEILPPIEVEADAIVGPVAYMMKKGEEDPLLDEPDTVLAKEEPKKKRRKKSRRDTMMGMMGEDMGDMMMGMGGYGDSMGGEEGASSEMMAGMMGGMGGMAGITGIAGGGGVSAQGRDFPGYRPSMGSRSIVAKSRAIVSVKALIPYKEQWDNFEQAFSEAMDYNPNRDVPKFLMFSAQRAEVPDDPSAELKWVPVANTNTEMLRLRNESWAGLPQEIADPRYIKLNTLTMPVPPIMMRDLAALALHSKVPRLQARTTTLAAADEEEETADPNEAITDALDSDLPGALPGGARAGMNPMMAGGPGMMGGMMPGGMGMEGYMGEEGGGEMGMMSGMMSGMGMGMEGYMGEGGEGDMGMMGMGMMGGTQAALGPQVDYLMVRFFDFTARPGKKYRYRVQVLLEDPNRPQAEGMSPRERALDDEVIVRLADVVKQEEQTSRRVYYRRTEWSEPSEPVEIEMPRRTLAGEIQVPRTIPVPQSPNGQFTIPADEPTATVMAVVFDPTKSVDVPGIVEAQRGSYLNFTMNADVIHPVHLQFKMLENYNFATDRLLVDFRGGEPIPGTKGDEEDAEPLMAPSEMIFLDEDGNFFVKSDMDDQDAFDLFVVPEAQGTGMPAMDEGFGDMGLYGEMEE